MRTVALPAMIVPIFVGGIWNDGPPMGMCGGVLVAVDPTVAAGILFIFTFELTLLSMMPLKGCGVGVGTGPPGDGTMTI
jgi:hypothetical protein